MTRIRVHDESIESDDCATAWFEAESSDPVEEALRAALRLARAQRDAHDVPEAAVPAG